MANYGKGGGLVMHINLQIDGLLSRYHISLDVFKPPCEWLKDFTFLWKERLQIQFIWFGPRTNVIVEFVFREMRKIFFLATFLGIVPMPSRYIRFNHFFK